MRWERAAIRFGNLIKSQKDSPDSRTIKFAPLCTISMKGYATTIKKVEIIFNFCVQTNPFSWFDFFVSYKRKENIANNTKQHVKSVKKQVEQVKLYWTFLSERTNWHKNAEGGIVTERRQRITTYTAGDHMPESQTAVLVTLNQRLWNQLFFHFPFL